jgi:formate/nitrite transporter
MRNKSSRDEVAPPQSVTFDAIMPATMALRAEASGVKRASTDPITLLVLGVLAGAFISFGAIFATTVGAGAAALPYGVVRLLMGLVFSVGLILVIVGGAELFTGNNIIVMAWASGKVKTRALLLNWVLTFTGNFVGAIVTAGLMFYTTQFMFGDGAVGLVALSTANAKTSLAFVPALTLGVMCNALVCLAVWMCFSARTIVDRVLAIVPPIAAFVAAGFIKAGAPDAFWRAIGKVPADFPELTWSNFLIGNLVPVTIGNIIGGSIMVTAVYWFVYLRSKKS